MPRQAEDVERRVRVLHSSANLPTVGAFVCARCWNRHPVARSMRASPQTRSLRIGAIASAAGDRALRAMPAECPLREASPNRAETDSCQARARAASPQRSVFALRSANSSSCPQVFHGHGLLAPRGNLPPAVQVACGARHCKVRAHGDEVLSRPRGASLRKATLICSDSRGVRSPIAPSPPWTIASGIKHWQSLPNVLF